jgi:hypothetical protein
MLGRSLGDAVLHIPLSRIAADPPALDDCVAYIQSEARQAVEFRPGSLGISGADGPGGGRRAIRVGLGVFRGDDRERGDRSAAARGTGQAGRHAGNRQGLPDPYLRHLRPCGPAAGRAGGPADADPVKPSQVDDVIEVVGDEVVPSLSEAPGFCAALLFADPASGA